jgi:putative transposase
MLLAYKIELQPNKAQKEYLDKACGTVRHCYNQLLEHFSKKENPYSLKAAYDFYKNTLREQFEWYKEISFHISANAIQDLHNAFSHFFRRVKLKQKPGYPKYHKKDRKESFSIRTPQKFGVFGNKLRIEKLKSYIRMREPIRLLGFTLRQYRCDAPSTHFSTLSTPLDFFIYFHFHLIQSNQLNYARILIIRFGINW